MITLTKLECSLDELDALAVRMMTQTVMAEEPMPGMDKPCMEWTGPVEPTDGYPRISVGDRRWKVSRVAWILYYDDIPEGMWVLHLCHNRKCLRPDHLMLGDAALNNQQTRDAGRAIYTSKSLSADDEETIRARHRAGVSYVRLRDIYDVPVQRIYRIVHSQGRDEAVGSTSPEE